MKDRTLNNCRQVEARDIEDTLEKTEDRWRETNEQKYEETQHSDQIREDRTPYIPWVQMIQW